MSLIVSFYAVPFPTRYLGWDLRLNWVNFWGFSYLLLSPQFLIHFSGNFDKTFQFQLLFPWPENDYVLLRSCATDFTRAMVFLQFFNSESCLCNSSGGVSGFSWNLPIIVPFFWREWIILYRGLAWLLLSELWLIVSFSHFINWNSCPHNSSYKYISQGILITCSSCCCSSTLAEGNSLKGLSVRPSVSPIRP